MGDDVIKFRFRVEAGRFVLMLDGTRREGLGVDDVLTQIDASPDADYEIYRIHRVVGDGRLELVGVTKASLKKRDCMAFSRSDADAARDDYEALSTYAANTPPPCKIELQYGHAPTLQPQHVVLMIFPEACQAAVGSWLAAASFSPGDYAEGSPAVLESMELAMKRIILTKILAP